MQNCTRMTHNLKLPLCVMFDLDGTLVDSEALTLPDLFIHLKELYGIDIDLDGWMSKGYHGQAGQALVDKLNAEFSTSIELNQFLLERQQRYEVLFEKQTLHVAQNLDKAITYLAQHNIPYCIATNSQHWRTQASLDCAVSADNQTLGRIMGAEVPYFSGRDDVSLQKPAPDVYLYAAEQRGVVPTQCVVVEDSASGVKAGVAAGMAVVGYTGTAHHPQEQAAKLMAAGCVATIADWAEFPELFVKA